MADVRHPDMLVTEPVKVHIKSVDSELAALWRGIAQGQSTGAAAPLTRTLLLNLLVYASTEADASDASTMVAELAGEYPARAIIADAEMAEPGQELEAEVSMFCSLGERGRRLCGEEIRLHAHGVNAKALGTIMPVLAPDLPVYLWTPGDLPASDEVLRSMVSVSDHWIVDSRGFGDLRHQYRRAAAISNAQSSHIALHDLAWSSLSQWMEMTAQLFDPVAARDYLDAVVDIRIECKASQDGRILVEPLMIAAWLIIQLAWDSPSLSSYADGSCRITAVAGEHDVEINIIPQPKSLSALTSVSLRSEINGRKAVFTVRHADNAQEMWLQTDAPDLPAVRRTAPVEPQSPTNHICRILDLPSKDKLYERTLPVFFDLLHIEQ